MDFAVVPILQKSDHYFFLPRTAILVTDRADEFDAEENFYFRDVIGGRIDQSVAFSMWSWLESMHLFFKIFTSVVLSLDLDVYFS